MNVNLFWVRSPARELDLIRGLLGPGGALYLFYGYGGRGSAAAGKAGQDASRIPGVLTEHLRERGFAVKLLRDGGVLGVVATPNRRGRLRSRASR
jgi:hypothetical protein